MWECQGGANAPAPPKETLIIVWNTTDPQIQSPYIEEYLKQTAAIQVLHVHVLS